MNLYPPVSGKVTAVNEKINTSPEMISKSPYGEGWMVKLEMSSPGELNGLMNNLDYQKYTEDGGSH